MFAWIRVLIFNVLLYATTIVVAGIGLLLSYGSGGTRRIRRILGAQAGFINWMLRVILGSRVEIRGLEQFKDGERPAIIASKHQSELDVFTPVNLFPDLAAISMIEISRYPLIGPVVRKLDFIMISVEGKRTKQTGMVVEGALRAREQGRPILIYPEGELMRIGARERYRYGVYHIYKGLQEPVTPVALSCGLVWPQRKWRKRVNRTCVIEFMPPIPPGLQKGEFMRLLQETIETRTMELIREHGTPEEIAIAEERHRLGLNNSDPEEKSANTSQEMA